MRFGRSLSCGWIRIHQSGSNLEFSFYIHLFDHEKKNVISLNGNRNLKIKFEFKIRNSFKQKLKLEFYVLFFEKLKINEKIHFLKGSLGDVTDRRSASAQKKISWKNEQKFIFQFLLKIEIGTSNLFFDLIMKTKNEKKKSKLYFILKQKSNVPFDPRIKQYQLKIEK